MQVILTEPIQGLGKLGDVVNVKNGYARNFLIPQNKALRASKENMASLEARKSELEAEQSEKRTAATAIAEKLADKSITIARPASETGHLYGSVKARDITDELNEEAVERSMIQIGEPIRAVGEHKVKIALHPEVVIELDVKVERASS